MTFFLLSRLIFQRMPVFLKLRLANQPKRSCQGRSVVLLYTILDALLLQITRHD